MAGIGGPEVIGSEWAAVLLLLTAVALAGWPLRRRRLRRRTLAGDVRPPVPTVSDDPLVEWVTGLRRDRPRATPLVQGDGTTALPAVQFRAVVASARNESGTVPAAEPDRVSAVAVSEATSWDLVTRKPWPWPAGGYRGPSRPSGPSGPPRRRDTRRPGGPPDPATETDAHRPLRQRATGPGSPARLGAPVTALAGAAGRPSRQFRVPRPTGSPRRTVLLVGLVGAAVGVVLAGPVAGVGLAAYGMLGARGLLRRQANGWTDRARRHRLDQLCGLAADLRAGLPVGRAAGPSAGDPDGSDRIGRLARAAVSLADRTGAPLAELVERIEADARSVDRGLAAAAAQAAGARATAWLLAALPLGGIGLGYGIGVDPVAVLLHTPVGGASAVIAIALQVAGLFWAERLTAMPRRDA